MENPATTPPEARIVDFKGQSVIGRSERFTMATRPKIPGLWDQTIAEIGARMAGQETFGVCYDFRDDAFNYLVAIANDGDVEGLDQMTIPAGRYAVFDHAGHISQIGDTWQAIFEKWVPTSGEALGEGPEFERYAADFDPNGVGKVSIWIPLKS